MHGDFISFSALMLHFMQVDFSPIAFVASDSAENETPLFAVWQYVEICSKEYSFPYMLHIVARQAAPHCMESNWYTILHFFILLY